MQPRIVSNHVCFSHPRPQQILAALPDAKVNGFIMGVPHNLDNTRVLRNLGVPAPSTIRTQYKFKGRFTPLPHQVVTAEACTLEKRLFILNDMGTMKTISSLWAADHLMELGIIRHCLIVSPLSTLERVWGDEIFKNFPRRRFAVLHGASSKRKELLASDVDFYIINHHGVDVVKEELRSRKDIDLFILDEGAIYRNSQTKMWKLMKSLITPERWVWLMTGSPTPNAPTDAYGEMKLIKPENYPGSFTKFREEVMQKQGPFKWVPRRGWENVVNRILRPSVRFSLEDCVNLPPTIYQDRAAELSPEQRQHFQKLSREAVTEIRGETVHAVNAGVLLSKLVQAACLAEGTEVMTDRGWVAIEAVLPNDFLWDGIEWVKHGGIVCNGLKPVIWCGGVRITEDHRMLTTTGWRTAGEINGNAGKQFTWEKVREPDCHSPRGFYYPEERVAASAMEMPMRLRHRSSSNWKQPSSKQSSQREALRLPTFKAYPDPRAIQNPALQYMGKDEIKMQLAQRQGLEKLRCPWNKYMRTVARKFREFLGGHVRRIYTWIDIRTKGQQPRILPRQLPMGDRYSAIEQQTNECLFGNPQGENDYIGSSQGLQLEGYHPACSLTSIQVELTSCARDTCKVFDILNCGPRNRFVVRGHSLEPRIVHNCGVVYSAGGDTLKIDFGPRLKILEETIEECNEKVIVFVPLTGTLNELVKELRKSWSVEAIDGSTPAGKRNQIFYDFQNAATPRIIVANPQTMAHGLTLTAATAVIWYAPIHSNEIYQQANARIARPGQTKTTNVVHMYATNVERRIYDTLKERGKMQDIVLEMARGKI